MWDRQDIQFPTSATAYNLIEDLADLSNSENCKCIVKHGYDRKKIKKETRGSTVG